MSLRELEDKEFTNALKDKSMKETDIIAIVKQVKSNAQEKYRRAHSSVH